MEPFGERVQVITERPTVNGACSVLLLGFEEFSDDFGNALPWGVAVMPASVFRHGGEKGGVRRERCVGLDVLAHSIEQRNTSWRELPPGDGIALLIEIRKAQHVGASLLK